MFILRDVSSQYATFHSDQHLYVFFTTLTSGHRYYRSAIRLKKGANSGK